MQIALLEQALGQVAHVAAQQGRQLAFAAPAVGHQQQAVGTATDQVGARQRLPGLGRLGYSVSDNDDTTISVEVDGEKVDDKAAKEIDKRIKDSSLLFLYNSTTRHDEFFFGRGRRRMFYEFVMSAEERKALDEAGKHIERRLKKLAKDHTEGLSNILGRLTEKYDVEVSPLEGFTAREMPLGINLKDKNV